MSSGMDEGAQGRAVWMEVEHGLGGSELEVAREGMLRCLIHDALSIRDGAPWATVSSPAPGITRWRFSGPDPQGQLTAAVAVVQALDHGDWRIRTGS